MTRAARRTAAAVALLLLPAAAHAQTVATWTGRNAYGFYFFRSVQTGGPLRGAGAYTYAVDNISSQLSGGLPAPAGGTQARTILSFVTAGSTTPISLTLGAVPILAGGGTSGPIVGSFSFTQLLPDALTEFVSAQTDILDAQGTVIASSTGGLTLAPEPTTVALTAAGLVVVGFGVRRRRAR